MRRLLCMVGIHDLDYSPARRTFEFLVDLGRSKIMGTRCYGCGKEVVKVL